MKSRHHRHALILSALLALGTQALAADDKILAAARAAQPAVIEALREMVAIESGTMDAAGLAKMADDVERRLKALGGAVQRQKASAGHSEVLTAVFKGTGRRKLMLIGHMDTVYWPGTIWNQPRCWSWPSR